MKLKITFIYFFLTCCSVLVIPSWAQRVTKLASAVSQPQPGPDKSLQFIENKNQWDKSVKYMAPLPGGNLYLQRTGFVYAFYAAEKDGHGHASGENVHGATPASKGHAYSVSFLGAQPEPKAITGQNATVGYRNYFLGNDPAKWASQVKSYEEVTYSGLYTGIDMHLYEQNTQLKYDFILQPHTNPAKIRMQYKGADQVSLEYGNLRIKTSVNDVTEQKPIAYQTINGKQTEIPCRFKLENNVVSFEFPEGYDATKELIIDPVLVFSTYSGSTADNWGFTATYDEQGNMYSGGIVKGTGFPATLGAFDTTWNGTTITDSSWDIGILKYNTNASGPATLLYATYIGGTNAEAPSSLVVNSKNELLILGTTSSDSYPTTAGAQDRIFNGGLNVTPISGILYSAGSDLIVSRLSPNGDQLLASTFLGGTGNDGLIGKEGQWFLLDKNYGDQFRGDILTDAADNIYIVSNTHSTNFPIINGFQTTYGGGTTDAVVAKLTPALTLQWSSFLGGTGLDAAYSIQFDGLNNIFIAGGSTSTNLPGTLGAFKNGHNGGAEADGFVAKINSNGSALQRLSYLGTSAYDQVYFVQLDGNGEVYLLGQTQGSYPVTVPGTFNGNGRQFIQKLNNNLTAGVFSTVFGSSNPDARVTISPTAFLIDNCSRIYIAGWGGGANTTGQYQNGNTQGLPVTSDATRSTTDGQDFYLMLLSQNASALEYATFFGTNQTTNQSGEHVDGGTSRFDKRGFVYQAVCGGCGGSSSFPTTPNAWSQLNKATNCNNAAFKYDINIVTAIAGTSQTVCANTAPFQLTGFSPATGGTWSGAGVTPSGFFTPSANLGSTVILTYSVASGSCISTSTKTISINPAPVVSFTGLPTQICLPNTAITLVGSPAGGTFTGPGITGNSFNPAIAGPGTHKITYSFTNNFNCTVTVSQEVAIAQNPVVIAGPAQQVCSDAPAFQLTGFSPAGGTWSGPGVSAGGLFTPSATLVGAQTLTYTVTNSFCVVAQTKTIMVNAIPVVSFTGLPASVCIPAAAITLTGSPAGGTFTGNGITGNTFNATTAGAGSHIITYSFTNNTGCTIISSQTVAVALNPVVNAGPNLQICSDAPAIQLTGFSPAGGTWSGTGVSASGLFTPSAAILGTHTLTYTVTNSFCTVSQTRTMTVNSIPVVSFTGLPPTLCIPATNITLTGSPAGGTFTGPGMSGNTFNGSTAGPGTHTIIYSFTNAAGCTITSSKTIQVANSPVVSAGPDERICSGSFPLMLTGFSPAGGSWSGTGVSANGLFTPSELIAGTHILTYTVTTGFCTISKTKTVIVDPTVKFTQGPAISLCPDSPTYTISNADITPLGGVWSGNGVSPTGIFTPSIGLVGTNTLTYFVTLGACNGASTKDITISAPPSIVAAAVPTECGSSTNIQGFAPFTAAFTNTSTGATSYLWEFGDGTTSTEMVPTHQYTKNGDFEVSLTAFYGNGCRVKQKIAGVLVEKNEMIPNIFTPNKDGINDTFIPRITCLPTNLKIYNRWGKLVYQKENYQNTWGADGVTDGIYYYQLTSSKGQIWKGWVEIVR